LVAKPEQCLARRSPQDLNAKLKKLLVEAMLDNVGLKDLASRKW